MIKYFIVDDFYPDPIQARNFGLTLNFKSGMRIKEDGTKHFMYPGTRAANPWPSNQLFLRQRWEEIIGEKIVTFRSNWDNTAYHIAYEESPNWIHLDFVKGLDNSLTHWAAVIYLTPNPPPRTGTTLYRHKKQGFGNGRSSELFYGRLEESNLPDKDDWIPHITIENVFNRCIIYDSTRFHAPTLSWFGDCKENGRLTQLGFFTSTGKLDEV